MSQINKLAYHALLVCSDCAAAARSPCTELVGSFNDKENATRGRSPSRTTLTNATQQCIRVSGIERRPLSAVGDHSGVSSRPGRADVPSGSDGRTFRRHEPLRADGTLVPTRHGDATWYQEPSQRYELTCMIKRLAQRSGFDTFKTNRTDTECSFPTYRYHTRACVLVLKRHRHLAPIMTPNPRTFDRRYKKGIPRNSKGLSATTMGPVHHHWHSRRSCSAVSRRAPRSPPGRCRCIGSTRRRCKWHSPMLHDHEERAAVSGVERDGEATM